MRFGLRSAPFVVLLLVAACTPTSGEVTTPTFALPDPAAVTTVASASTAPIAPTTTSDPPARRLLAPGWEVVGEGDRIGGLMFGTSDELIVWGGSPLPAGTDQPADLFNGVVWNHVSGTSQPLPAPPFRDCSGFSAATWTKVEMVVWFRPYADPGCAGGGVAAYDPHTRVWRTVEAPDFLGAGQSAVWTGDEILAWRQGLALEPSTGVMRHFKPLEIDEGSTSSLIQAHWTGRELLVMGGASLHRYQPETDLWDRLKSPPIGVIAQASAWTGERLLAVNYLMEAALFDPVTGEWTRIESMPLRFMESIPVTSSSETLTLVGMALSMAVLDGQTWVAVPGPVMEWTGGFPYGSNVIIDGWIYHVGNFVLRRPVPSVIGDGIQTESAIPLQTMLFAVPEGWTAQLALGGSTEHHTYQLSAEDGRSCQLDAVHGKAQPVTSSIATVYRSWDHVEMRIAVDLDENLAVVDDSEQSSDWTAIRCDSPESAQFIAAHIWVSP